MAPSGPSVNVFVGVSDISHIPLAKSRFLRWDPHYQPRDMRKEIDRDVTSQNLTKTNVSGRQASTTWEAGSR